ncbi:23496_t:CDS:2 [Gigaspora margarita]|uniref:23496_t:CDS:1 n=1 Tax=Gigaspora margarita TaxID=4874 RepID=A0ABN7WYL2_GIGMA|nr:23496_t:CDS:2 [Gigaspora margarita]
MSSSKRKDKTTLTNKQRQDIVTYKSKYPNITNVELIDWVKKEFKLDVHPSMIGCLIKNKDDIGNNPTIKRQRTVQHPELENALLEWVKKHGEDMSVDDNVVAATIPQLKKLLKEYDLKDIYNMDDITN